MSNRDFTGKKYHKEVYAAKIKAITEPHSRNVFYELIFVDPAFPPIQLPRFFIEKYMPQPGQYYVDNGTGGGSFILSEYLFEMQYTLSPPPVEKPKPKAKKVAKKTAKKGKSNG